jgi:hypothetical protein
MQVSPRRVRAIRNDLGIPPLPRGSLKTYATLEDAFYGRAVQTDDGHLLWPTSQAGRNRMIRRDGANLGVLRVAFRIGYGREPEGIVLATCDRTGCVHPKHVIDQPLRDKFRAIIGDAG